MQIQSSVQTNFLNTHIKIVSEKPSVIQTNNHIDKASSINTGAYDYFELGEDISQYQEIDPVQEQTNKDIVNFDLMKKTGAYFSTFSYNSQDNNRLNLTSYFY
ncbi:MAG: hypothetical protein ACI9TV_002878 [Sulfurimonas sp.]|jgi:hypothetical protein|uniref:hypothetical protein n=1 Tax=Sulfurimonas sp. TaxID=2022749 RepID=UPI0039E6A299